jgi:hypothetical protein
MKKFANYYTRNIDQMVNKKFIILNFFFNKLNFFFKTKIANHFLIEIIKQVNNNDSIKEYWPSDRGLITSHLN